MEPFPGFLLYYLCRREKEKVSTGKGMAGLMAIKIDDPDIVWEQQTSPKRSGGWFRWLRKPVKLAMEGDEEEFLLINSTHIPWRVYHNYHQLGIIDAHERRTFKLAKQGSLSARPYQDGENIEYLVLPLNQTVYRVSIYERRMGKAVEVYDMRVA